MRIAVNISRRMMSPSFDSKGWMWFSIRGQGKEQQRWCDHRMWRISCILSEVGLEGILPCFELG